jgi:hypothetical protein
MGICSFLHLERFAFEHPQRYGERDQGEGELSPRESGDSNVTLLHRVETCRRINSPGTGCLEAKGVFLDKSKGQFT